jgi:tRNA pseudouridine38-40 synthase
MYRYKCIVKYDGYNYMGFQIQNELPTIELALVEAIKKMLDVEIKIYASGRTDRYVHAVGQVVHFDLENHIPAKGLQKGMNSYLPPDIHISDCEEVGEDFHSRFSAKSKEYRYYINYKEYNPLTIRYAPNITNLDIDKMQDALKSLVGTHDFKGFASASIDPRKETVKTIYDVKLNVYDNYLEFIFIGNGFLKYQIRRMMGLIIEIGRGKETKDMLLEVLEKKDPKISHKVADGCGLYLYKVNY